MRRYVHLRFDIWLTLLIVYGISLGAAKLTELILPSFYEGYVEENTIAQDEVGGPAGEDVFRAQSVADLLSHDTFTVVSPGIKYYNNGSAMFGEKVADELMLPSGEFVMAIINGQNIQWTEGEDYFTSDHILPVGRVVFQDLTADPDFLEQIQGRGPLSRTDFYVDMSGSGGLVSEDVYNERWTGVVQVAVILAGFPLLHSVGAKLGIFPFFFAPRPKKGENTKGEWD